MSQQENNICSICGGVKRVDWTISFEECHPVEVRFDPASLAENWRLCPGHPEPAVKHDGNLDDDYKVGYGSEWDIRGVRIQANDPSVVGNDVFLVPHRAISLLTWLTQERAELERLVKEQGF